MSDESIQHELAVMNRTGDTKTIWSPDNPVEVEVARDAFNKLRSKGYSIFKVNKEGGAGKRMDTFDPQAGKLIAVPAIVGG